MNEVLDGLGISEVALKCSRREKQVVAHQPCDGFGLRLVEPEPRAQLQRDLCADNAMVAAAAFGDVVEQYRDIQHPPRGDLFLDDGGG